MGFFDIFKKKKKQKAENLQEEMFPKELSHKTKQEKSITVVIDCCEQMAEAKRQIQDIKAEYQAVTEYLTDIQKIELIPEMEKARLEKAAKNIIIYTKEREKYKTKETKITEHQRNTIEKFESDLSKDLKRMKENESYAGVIKSDMGYLEGEKKALLRERKEIIKKQDYLKKISVVTSVLVISLFALILALSAGFNTDMSIPFILTIVMAAGSACYIFLEANKNRKEMNLAGRKLDKAIGLLNKVKIKYINNTSLLEYTCEKYGISSSEELDYIWKQYIILVENERKYAQNTQRLSDAKDRLTEVLELFDLMDSQVWVHQAEAILEKREMVEVRHNLNLRRQRLRDNLDYNTQNYNENQKEIESFIENNKEMRDEVISILRNYHIQL